MIRVVTGAALLVLALNVFAEDVTVKVRDKAAGTAVADVSVCLGTTANPHQFGAFRSDRSGSVGFTDLPRSAHLLTVSKPGYRGVTRLLEPMSVERVVLVDLARGGGGPVCAAPRGARAQGATAADGPRVLEFTLNNGALRTGTARVQLNHRVDGEVNQYRASESGDFAGVSWQPYVTSVPEFDLSAGAGEKRVYLQVRRYREINGASIESVSPVVSDTIRRD